MPKIRRRYLTFVKFALTVGLLWLLVKQIDINKSWDAARKISPVFLSISLLLEIVQIIIVTFRWQFVIKVIGARLSFSRTLELLILGMFLGQILPGAIGGDVVRVWKTRQAGLSTSAAINSVMLERIVAVVGLLFLLMLTIPIAIGKYYELPFGVWLFPSLMLMVICVVGIMMFLDRTPPFLDRWMIAHHLASLARDTRRLFLDPKNIIGLLILSVVGQVNLCLQVWVLALGMNTQLSLWDSLLLVPPVILMAYLPISLAGWGVREVAMVAALAMVGISSSQALAISVIFGLVGIVASLPGFLFWLRAKREVALDYQAGE